VTGDQGRPRAGRPCSLARTCSSSSGKRPCCVARTMQPQTGAPTLFQVSGLAGPHASAATIHRQRRGARNRARCSERASAARSEGSLLLQIQSSELQMNQLKPALSQRGNHVRRHLTSRTLSCSRSRHEMSVTEALNWCVMLQLGVWSVTNMHGSSKPQWYRVGQK
jgi:hypothetical protein